jgi:Leu/Phe-tRNA-protein transferase
MAPITRSTWPRSCAFLRIERFHPQPANWERGGIFGLSLINSIFVESMMSDNNDVVLAKIENLESKINQLIDNQDKET